MENSKLKLAFDAKGVKSKTPYSELDEFIEAFNSLEFPDPESLPLPISYDPQKDGN